MRTNLIENLTRTIEANIKDRYEEGAVIADLLASAGDQEKVEAMSFLIQNYDVLEPTGVAVPLTGRRITNERWDELRKTEGELMDAQVKRAFLGFPSPETASTRLVSALDAQSDTETRDFFVANLLADSRVPYFGMPSGHQPLQMGNERFRILNRQLRRQIKQIEFIIRHLGYYEQRTERASLVLAVLNSVAGFEEQAVLMCHVLRVPEEAAQHLLDQLKSQ